MREAMYTVVILSLAGTVEEVVGPFWEETSADYWGQRVAAGKHNRRYVVRPLVERGMWDAQQSPKGEKS